MEEPEIIIQNNFWSWELYDWRKKIRLKYNHIGKPTLFEVFEKIFQQRKYLIPAECNALPKLRAEDIVQIHINRIDRKKLDGRYVWSVMFVVHFTKAFAGRNFSLLCGQDAKNYWVSVEGLNEDLVQQLIPITISAEAVIWKNVLE